MVIQEPTGNDQPYGKRKGVMVLKNFSRKMFAPKPLPRRLKRMVFEPEYVINAATDKNEETDTEDIAQGQSS